MDIKHIPAADFIPHRPPIAFADFLEGPCMPFVTAYTVPEESPYVDGGFLIPEALLEVMAQCFAAGAGFRESQAGGSVSWGYLAGVKGFRVHAPVRSGDILRAECTVTASVGPIHVVEGEVMRGGEKIASAQIKIFIPEAAEND